MTRESNTISPISSWISAARPRTLPLALSSIFMGSGLAAVSGYFRWDIFCLACLTTILLQILSNLANDYGDSVHGADSQTRKGPSRAVQAGLISAQSMKKAMILVASFSFISGISLLLISFWGNWLLIASFLGLGIAAIFAAIAYTNGKRPYGYEGYGDISVFLFFGLLGVAGSNYLFTQHFEPLIFLPACINGFLATGVLNVNNIRDIESDKQANKNSIPVRIGLENAKWYHTALITLAMISGLAYYGLTQEIWFFYDFPAIGSLLLIPHLQKINTYTGTEKLDPQLKVLSLSTLAYTILFIAGLLLSKIYA